MIKLMTSNRVLAFVLILFCNCAFAQQDFAELGILTTGPGTSDQYFKHIFLFTKVMNENRLRVIGESYQSKFSNDIVTVYFCNDKDQVPTKVPNIAKASEWEHITFTYMSNPFTKHKQLIDQRSITSEQKKAGPPYQGKTNSQKEYARSFYERNKNKGVIVVKVYGLFIDVTLGKKAADEILSNRARGEQRIRSWYSDAQKFFKRDGQNDQFAVMTVIHEGDEIATVDYRGIKFH